MDNRTTVFIADSTEEFCSALSAALHHTNRFQVVGTANDGEQAIRLVTEKKPDILVLDEPTAGLDPQGALEMMRLFRDLNKIHGTTIIMVTHDMEQVFGYCDEVVVMENGKPTIHTTVQDFFKDASYCDELNILPPALIRMKDMLKEKGFALTDDIRTLPVFAHAIAKQVKHHG